MIDIKTIKGKVLFEVVPYTDLELAMWNLLTDNEAVHGIKLSEITEEQASLLVETLFDRSYRDYSKNGIGYESFPFETAKESLFSLLKANDCQTKQMVRDGYYYHAHVLDEAGHMKQQDVILRWEENKENLKKKVFAKPIDEFPDDYLLIVKQC